MSMSMSVPESPEHKMSVVRAIQTYVAKMIAVPGMKALIMDHETTAIVSLVYFQSNIIKEDVYLVERIDAEAKSANMQHLKAVVFVRPTHKVLQALKAHLKAPKFKEYHLFFSNMVSDEYMRNIAEADEYDVVKQIHEYFADFYAVNADLWHLNLSHTRTLWRPPNMWGDHEDALLRRNVDGIIAFMLAMKKQPAIRYSSGSDVGKRVAYEVSKRIQNQAELFHFKQKDDEPPLLLIVDRRDDPVTPLLLQWTYQAMVHELLEIHNNRVDLSKVPNVNKDVKEVVLSADQDRFFRGSMFLNYGDLGASIKDLVEEYGRTVKSNQNIQSIEDMARFVDRYPEFKQQSGNVSKHVALMSEMNRLVEQRDLMSVSEIEQDIVCNNNHTTALEGVMRLMQNNKLTPEDRLRLVILYGLRYDRKNQMPTLRAMLRDRCPDERSRQRVMAVDAVMKYAEGTVREDLFGSVWDFFGSVVKPFKGVENIYTQHKPLLATTLDNLLKGKLKTATYPYVINGNYKRHSEIYVYMVGGTTYEEAATVSKLNNSNVGVRIVLGGSYIHNSKSFITDVLGAHDRYEMEEKRDLGV